MVLLNGSEDSVLDPYYSINSAKNFFGGTDPIRVIIIIYIFLSFIFNLINFIVIGITLKKTKKEFLFGLWVMLSVLLMNFIHTFTYFFEWVIKEDVETIEVDVKGHNVEVGALLTGNPKHMGSCKTQGFLLIFSSISQDFLINIFFYLVNSSEFNKFYVKCAILLLGIIFPFFYTLIMVLVGAIGLNDSFCYVKKFNIDINEYKDGDSKFEIVHYSYYDGFQPWVIVVYLIRIFNFVVTVYFLKKIWTYVTSENKPIYYLFKSVFIPIIQLFTIGIGVLYRFINLISSSASAKLAGAYLILNTVDGVLFPIGFALQNGIFSQLKNIISGKEIHKEPEPSPDIEFTEREGDDEETPETPKS